MTGNEKGFTLIELLIVVGLVGVLAAIAGATMMNSRISGNEASAMGSLRAVVTAEMDYQSLNPGYAVNLATLATACPTMSAPFLSQDLNANGVVKSGFAFTLLAGAASAAGPNDCNGIATQTGYYASAVPTAVGTSGNRAFAVNQNGGIWQDTTGVAPAEPFVAGGTVSPIGR